MSNDDESQFDRSDSETQFIPQEDDDETLWEVFEITAEKGKCYKVRWKGVDPATNKPWAQSWVPKHDCTDDLVRDWKLRQAKKKKASTRDAKKSRASIATVKSSVSGLTSNTRASSSKSDRGDSTRLSTSTTTAAPARRSKPTNLTASVRKKIRPPLRTRSRSPLSPTCTSPSPELNVNTAAASSTSTKTGAKRKHGETTSATTSASSTFPTANAKGPDSISGSVPPPRKKRKLEVELVNNYEHSASSAEVDGKRKLSSPVIASHDVDDNKIVELSTKVRRRNQSQAAEEEEEADERMVEESLSDMHYSPRPCSPPQEPSYSQQEEGTSTPVRVKRPARMLQVTAEESTPRPQREMDSPPTVLARTSSKVNPPTKKSTQPSSPSSPSSPGAAPESHPTTEHRILSQGARSKTTPEENNPSPEKPVPDQASRSAAGSGSHALSGRGTESIPLPVLPRAGPSAMPSTSIVIPITPPKNSDSGGNDEKYVHRSPILSPRAKKRLIKFDMALTRIELEKREEKERLIIPDNVQKSREREREEEKGETAVGGGSRRQEHEVVRTSEENSWKGKAKDKTKDDEAQAPKPPEIEKKKKSKPLFLPDESDFEEPAVRPKKQDHGKWKSTSISKETSQPPNPVLPSGSDTNLQATSKPVSKTTVKAQSDVNANAAQARPPSTTTVRRSANPRSNSFVNDIIPESEESQSRSQETDLQVPAVAHPLVPPKTPSSNSTVKSRMKAKTPQSKSRPLSRTSSAVGALFLGVKMNMDLGVDNDVDVNELDGVDEAVKKISKKKANENGMTTKPFGPIPRISPSAFRNHLPSSLPESIIESTEGDGDAAAKRVADRNEEDDSIEQFESPTKDPGSTLGGERRIGILNAASRQEREKRTKESASDIWNSDVNRRGQELAEAARKREKERLRAEEKSALPAAILMKAIPQAINTADSATAGASTSAMAGIEGSQSVEAELKVDNDIDADTETGTGVVEEQQDPIHLRREEEESTQDVMMELRLHQQQQGIGVGRSEGPIPKAINDTGDLAPAIQIDSQPISEAILNKDDAPKRIAGNNEKSDRSSDEIPSIIVENPSRASLPRSYSSLENRDGVSRPKVGSRSRKSRSRSRSVSSQKSQNEKEADPEAEIPATNSTHRESLQALSQPADPQMESAENPHHLGAAMHLLNIKSEEISKLEYQLSAEQRRNEDLLEQLSALHHPESTNDAATKKLELELAEARAQLASQTTSWENERASLVVNIETATRSKVSAEKDRDFFQEQYAKASGFVTSVRDENAELEKQIKIATDQSRSGVSLIKSTFELRIKSLEEDVRAWRRMAEFLIDKDRRTNDDIRKRAGEEPELRARCDRQEGALEDSFERLDQLETDLEENQRKLLEAERWEEVTVKLNLELIEAKTKLEKIGNLGIGDDEKRARPNGHEFVYRCRWILGDSSDVCEAVFLHLSELQEHLYSAGHLQR